jgi:hypothetical protein
LLHYIKKKSKSAMIKYKKITNYTLCFFQSAILAIMGRLVYATCIGCLALAVSIACCTVGLGQQAVRKLPADSLLQANATRMAQAMRDSLKLTNAQANKLKDANLQIAYAKRQARADTALTPAKMTGRLQRAENMRDSLYRTILPTEKYTEYTKHRATLLTAW